MQPGPFACCSSRGGRLGSEAGTGEAAAIGDAGAGALDDGEVSAVQECWSVPPNRRDRARKRT
jgi:hypothetical protein